MKYFACYLLDRLALTWYLLRKFYPMRQSSPRKSANQTQETEKAPFFVFKRIREAIFDEVFRPETA